MRFLKGNVLFFALLLLAIMLFVYYAMRGMGQGGESGASCRVSFSDSCGSAEYRVFIDDSLLYAGLPLAPDSQLVMKRYATMNSSVSLYTSKSLIKVVAGGDTVSRVLQGDRLFIIDSCDGVAVVVAVDK